MTHKEKKIYIRNEINIRNAKINIRNATPLRKQEQTDTSKGCHVSDAPTLH